jgi:hypothetical protein
MSDHPKPNQELEVIASDEGFVIHDARRGIIHYLNETAAVVFSLCDGRRSVLEIADLVQQHYGLEQPPIDDITQTVAELTEQGVMVE